jgi:hypothetical protein
VSNGGLERTASSAVPAGLTLANACEPVERMLGGVANEDGLELCLRAASELRIQSLGGPLDGGLEALDMPREEAMPMHHARYGWHDWSCLCSALDRRVV